MPFTPLSSRVAALPDVLVGPVLRLVLATEVNVFLVFKAPTKVTLEVFASELGGNGVNRMMDGTRSTVPLGTGAVKLHTVCVRATGPPLTPGTQYVYNVKLGPHGGDGTEVTGSRRLFTDDVVRATGNAARDLLLYPSGPGLPSFVLPPDDVDELRILHASCRKPHGEGQDAMAIGDDIVAGSFTSLDARPHQLFLGGDQIYADDVAVGLLAMLLDAAAALGLPVEQLPAKGGTKVGADFHPHARTTVLGDADAGLTSDHLTSHLMTFAEYALMYVFAWSDVLWPADLPDFAAALPAEHAEFAPDFAELLSGTGDITEAEQVRHHEMPLFVLLEMGHVDRYRDALPQVRRLLANTPSLMCFDDHEITDDWNLNLDWMRRTQDPAKLADGDEPTALGRAIIRNGLAAFAIFQAWGNTPAQFAAGAAEPGTALLGAVAAWNGGATAAQTTQIAQSVGLPTGFTPNTASPTPSALKWHYSHRWAAHQVIVLDTRTRRGAVKPADANGAPALIHAKADFDAMVRTAPAPGPEELVIVIAPAPVFGVPLHEAAARHLHAPWAKIAASKDPEHWALTPYAREHLLGALLSRPAAGADGVIRARAIVLSGDVHHGSAVHVRYSATKPFRYAGRVEGVIAQLTSSALKNQAGLTMKIESLGFTMLADRGMLITLGAMPLTEVSGWENIGGAKKVVGREQLGRTGRIKVRGEPGVFEYTYGVPFTHPPTSAVLPFYLLTEAPEWQYQVRPQRGVLVGRGTPAAVAASAASRDEKVNRAVAAAQQHRSYSVDLGAGQDVVGHNNIGDVSFVWNAGEDKAVIQNLWWRPEDDLDAAPLTRWEVRLSTTAP